MEPIQLHDVLPFQVSEGSYVRQWPQFVHSTLITMSQGPLKSHVSTGENLSEVIRSLRKELQLGSEYRMMAKGLTVFFDEVRFF